MRIYSKSGESVSILSKSSDPLGMTVQINKTI